MVDGPDSTRVPKVPALLRRLTDLMLADEYDEDFLRPTRAAFEAAWNVLVAAEERLPSGLPLAAPAPVGDGGILIQWDRGDRSVFLAVPADPKQGYIYSRGPDLKKTVRTLSGPASASALKCLLLE